MDVTKPCLSGYCRLRKTLTTYRWRTDDLRGVHFAWMKQKRKKSSSLWIQLHSASTRVAHILQAPYIYWVVAMHNSLKGFFMNSQLTLYLCWTTATQQVVKHASENSKKICMRSSQSSLIITQAKFRRCQLEKLNPSSKRKRRTGSLAPYLLQFPTHVAQVV